MNWKLPSVFRWNTASAWLGGVAWIAGLLWSRGGRLPLGTIEGLFLLAPLVIVPMGLRLALRPDEAGVAQRLLRLASRLQPFGAVLVVASFWFAPGLASGSLAVGWLLITGLVALSGLLRVGRTGLRDPEQLCPAAGLLFLVVGGVGLFCSRLGIGLLGFEEPIVLLTAVHFHYTGFAVPLMAGAAGQIVEGCGGLVRALFRVAAVGVIASPPLIATGFLFSPFLQVVSVFLLTVSLFALSLVSIVVLSRVRPRIAQLLIVVSASSLVVGMGLVVVYAVGEFTGRLLISIPQMARTHGVINGLGFTLCGLLGWSLTVSPSERALR